jgi:hypothetical protein
MALDAQIVGASLDTNNNIKVATPLVANQAGYVILAGELAEPTDPTGRIVSDIRTSAQGRLSVGTPNILLNEIFSSTVTNTSLFNTAVAGASMAVAATAAGFTLNSGAVTVTVGSAILRTYAFFPFYADLSTFAVWEALYTQVPQVNCTVEMGFGQAASTTAPTDGAFFRFDSTGAFKAVLNNNSTEQMVTIDTIPSANAMHKYKIMCENDSVLYYVDGICVARILSASSAGMPMLAQNQPWYLRMYHATPTPPLASQLKIGYLCIGNQDANGLNRSMELCAAISGRMGSQIQQGVASGQTANNVNVTATTNPAGAAMTNTTAALGTGLGGVFSCQPTLAQGIDGILCSYLNPVATAVIPGRTLYIKGVKVSGIVTTNLTGGPLAFGYYLGYGNTALTLVGTDSSTAKFPRRTAIGVEGCAATATVGTLLSPVGGAYMAFTAPIAVNPGEYVEVIARNFGTVTSAGVVTFVVSFDAFWE